MIAEDQIHYPLMDSPWHSLEWGKHRKRAKAHAWLRGRDGELRVPACSNVEPQHTMPDTAIRPSERCRTCLKLMPNLATAIADTKRRLGALFPQAASRSDLLDAAPGLRHPTVWGYVMYHLLDTDLVWVYSTGRRTSWTARRKLRDELGIGFSM